MYRIYKANVRTPEGEYLETQHCKIICDDIEYSRMELYSELQPDYLPQIIDVDLFYISTKSRKKFKLHHKIKTKEIIYSDGM